jgi:hypothetical protein
VYSLVNLLRRLYIFTTGILTKNTMHVYRRKLTLAMAFPNKYQNRSRISPCATIYYKSSRDISLCTIGGSANNSFSVVNLLLFLRNSDLKLLLETHIFISIYVVLYGVMTASVV